MPTSQQEGQEGPVPTRTPMRPARDRGPRRGLREVPPRLRRVLVAPEGVRLGVRTARSHITGPIRGQGKGHATTGPGARRSGSPGQVSPGSRWGAQDRSSGNPELGRSQGEQTPGRWTRDGWGPPALGGLTNAAQSITGSDSDPGLRLDRGAVHGKAPLGLGPGAGRELTRGPHGLLPLRRDPGPATLPRVGRLRPSLTPGRTSGPRGQGPGWTNPGSGKPRADARIQNPSGAPPRPRITRSEPGDCGLTRPVGHMSRPDITKGRPRLATF
jgi:hypothetical protein